MSSNMTGYKSRFKKPAIITLAIIIVMVLVAICVVLASPKNTPETGDDISYDKTADFTKIQKLFTKLCGNRVVLEFMEKDYFQKEDQFEIETFANRTGRITVPDTNEYISYDIVNEEEDSPDTAINFAYHEPFDDLDTYVIKSGELTYQHFDGHVTTDYDNIEDAIMAHQLLQ